MRTHIFIVQFFVFWLLVLASTLMPGRARAIGQEVCNETSYIIYLATGIPQGKTIRTEGWVRLRPGQCRIVLPAPFGDAPHFAYGYSSEIHAGGRQQWGGREDLCVDLSGNFSLDGRGNCAELGLEDRKFNLINVNPPDGGRTIMSEPANFGTRAELAGIQRLLKDNGYAMRVVDGYDGRRTRSAIRKFLSNRKISPRPENMKLIDALEAAARETLAQTGLRVCNKTTMPVWTAYGRRKAKAWESRGWWSIAPGACTSLISGLLADKEIYFYAGLVQNNAEHPLASAREKFCVSDILFAIDGRRKCTDRGYYERNFALYKNVGGKGITITLTANDFAKADILAGLRR